MDWEAGGVLEGRQNLRFEPELGVGVLPLKSSKSFGLRVGGFQEQGSWSSKQVGQVRSCLVPLYPKPSLLREGEGQKQARVQAL